MSMHVWPWPAAAMRRASLWRYRLPAVLAAAAVLIQGCAAAPPRPFGGDDASDPNVRVAPAGYRPVLGNYSTQRPVEPLSWRERNDRAAPKPKQGEQ